MSAEPELHEGEEEAPRGARAAAVVRWMILAAVAVAAVFSIAPAVRTLIAGPAAEAKHAPRYHCPMHPQITSDVPGECPICHMDLELIPEPSLVASPTPTASGASGHTAPSDPTAMPRVAPPPTQPPDAVPIVLGFDRIQAIGVRTAVAEKRGQGVRDLSLPAAIEAPERGRALVHIRTSGNVDSVLVAEVGTQVKAGQLLATVFSPEVFGAEQELLAASRWSVTPLVGGGGLAPPTEGARRRLEILGLGRAQIDRVMAGGAPTGSIGVIAPIAGTIVRREAILGARVTLDTTLYEIADLREVYAVASAYSADLGRLHVGDEATFESPTLPGKSLRATVDLVSPDIDPMSRTARIRIRLPNPDGSLRPGQFGRLVFPGVSDEAVVVPSDAVVDTGRSIYVFIAKDGGVFEPRLVEIGDERDGRITVLRGIAAGDRIVSGATFLIDAESRLQASLTGQTSDSPTEAP